MPAALIIATVDQEAEGSADIFFKGRGNLLQWHTGADTHDKTGGGQGQEGVDTHFDDEENDQNDGGKQHQQ
jgi:hypothetical protein